MPDKTFVIAIALMLAVGPLLQGPPQTGPATGENDTPPADGRSSRSTFREEGDHLILENALIHLRFNRTQAGGLASIYDPVLGEELRPDTSMPAIAFEMVLWNGSKYFGLNNLDNNTFSYQGTNSGGSSSLELRYDDIGNLSINMTITVEVRDDEVLSHWSVSVENDEPSIAVVQVGAPVIAGLAEDIGDNGEGDLLAAPKYDGMLYEDPQGHISGGGLFDLTYPSTLSMQFAALYDPEVNGLYMSTLDPDGHPKRFLVGGAGQDGYMATVIHMGPRTAGADLTMPYDTVIGILDGDWYDAADIYRSWARSAPWTSEGPIAQRTDMPDWWLRPSPVVVIEETDRGGNPVVDMEEWSEVVAHYKGLTGTNITLWAQGWERNGTLTGPHYLPAGSGGANLTDEAKEVLVAGGRVMLSTSARSWRLEVPDLGYDGNAAFQQEGMRWAVLDRDGGPTMDPVDELLGVPSAVMDTSTAWWKDMVEGHAGGIASMAVDVHAIDDLPAGAWYPCYNASHGHDEGWGRYITDGHLTLLDGMMAAGRDYNPDYMLTAYGPNELLIDKIQSYMSFDNMPGRTPHGIEINGHGTVALGDDAIPVPMFSYVYHPYTTTYGTPVGLDDTEANATFSSTAYGIASAVVLGKMASVSTGWDGSDDPDLKDLFVRAAEATATYAKEYLFLGDMLRPPTVGSPLRGVTYRDPYDAGGSTRTLWDHQVLNSAWKSRDGSRIGHVLVNWCNTSIDINIGLTGYHLSNDNFSVLITRNGERSTLVPSTSLPTDLTISIGPRDIVLLEVVVAPDVVVGPITSEPEEPVDGDMVDIEVEVANRGSVPLDDIDIYLYVDDVFTAEATVPHLDPDTNTTVIFPWNTTGLAPVEPATFDIMAKVWPVTAELDMDNNEAAMTMTVSPVPKGHIRCTVIDDETLDPIVGAEVTLFDPDSDDLLDLAITKAGTDVLFELLLPATYGINVTAEGYHPAENRTVEVVAEEVTIVTMALEAIPVVSTRGDLVGHVTDLNTTLPVTGARVYLPVLNMTYYTAGDGAFTFLNIEQGDYSVEVSRQGYHTLNTTVTVVGGTTTQLNITLMRMPSPVQKGDIVGAVLDEDTDLPIPNAIVILVERDETVLTNESGGFRFAAIAFGNYTLNVTAEGHIGTDVVAVVTAEGDNLVTVHLKAVWVPPPILPSIRGFVTDGKGRPLMAVTVNATPYSGEARVAYTGPDGQFRLDDLDRTVYTVTISLKDYRSQEHTISVTGSGTHWLNVTMEKKASGEADDGTATIALLVLNALMVALIIILIVTGKGRKEGAGKKKTVAKRGRGRKVAMDEEVGEEE